MESKHDRDITNLKNEMSSQISQNNEAINNRIDGFTTITTNLSSKIDQTKSELGIKIASNAKNINTLNDTSATHTQQISSLTSDLDALKGSIPGTIDDKVKEEATKIMKALEKQKDELQEKITENDNKIESKSREFDEKIKKITKKIDEDRQNITLEIDNKIKAVEDKLNQNK